MTNLYHDKILFFALIKCLYAQITMHKTLVLFMYLLSIMSPRPLGSGLHRNNSLLQWEVEVLASIIRPRSVESVLDCKSPLLQWKIVPLPWLVL